MFPKTLWLNRLNKILYSNVDEIQCVDRLKYEMIRFLHLTQKNTFYALVFIRVTWPELFYIKRELYDSC